MSKLSPNQKALKRNKIELGNLIKEQRASKSNSLSMRKLAEEIGIPPSNLKYIEDGVNAPSPDVYEKIMNVLNFDNSTRDSMDRLYSLIRKTPPPDVCKIIIANSELNNLLRILSGHKLSKEQIKQTKNLFNSFFTQE